MEPKDLYEQRDQVQLIDVRESHEWQAGRIPGARWIPMNELPDRVGEVEQQQSVITICRSGKRSGEMAEFLSGRGYRAENLNGGIQAWAEQDLPVRTPDDEQPGKVV